MSERPLLSPSFLHKLDKSLLVNNPVTWTTRFHQAAWYGILFAMFIAIIAFIVPDDPRGESSMYYWITLLIIISLLAFIVWQIFVLRFNVFKRFGRWSRTDTLKTYILYFLVILLIVSWPYIPPIVQSIRANWAYSSSELVRDMNNINLKIVQLERDSINKKFDVDTLHVDNTRIGMRNKDGEQTMYYENEYSSHYIDTGSLRLRLAELDGYYEKKSDSLYVTYTAPNYKFVSNWDISEDSTVKTLSNYDIYKLVFNTSEQFNNAQIKKELDVLLKKYYFSPPTPYTYYYATGIERTYRIDHLNDSFEHIAERKYRWSHGMIMFSIRFAFYSTLVLSLLMLMYRHVPRRTFFLTLLAGVIITILTSLFTIGGNTSESGFFIWLLIYFIIFSIIAATIFSSRTRTAITGIALNLAVSLVMFVPLLLTAIYYNFLRDKYLYREDSIQYRHLFENESLHLQIAEISGFAILLLLLGTVVGAAYRRWYSLPEL